MSTPMRRSKRTRHVETEVHDALAEEVAPAAEETTVEAAPATKKTRKAIADAAAQAVAEVGKATPTTTEEEIAKTMVEGATAADGPKDGAKAGEEGKEPEKMDVDDEKKASEPADKTAAMPPLKPDATVPADSAITAEAVAAMAGAASIPVPQPKPVPVYKKEQEEYEEPDDGEEIPEEDDATWNAKLMQLLLYKAQYRTLHVQASYDAPLHTWVDVQRRLYRRHRKDPNSVGATTKMRLTALDAINFPFTLRGAAHWDRYFNKLQEFNKKHGHCLVPRLCEFAGLGDWVIDQRRQYKLMMQGKPSVLDPERQRKLEEQGFVWVVRNRPEWNNRFDELKRYKEKYGDTKVPQHFKEIPGLGKWVAKQREQFRLLSQGKHSFLTPDRLEKLNDAGFVWSVRKDATDDIAKIEGKSPTKKEGDVKEEGAATKTEEEKPKEGEEAPPPLKGEAAGETPAAAAPAVPAVADPQNPVVAAGPETTEAVKPAEGEAPAAATDETATKEEPAKEATVTV